MTHEPAYNPLAQFLNEVRFMPADPTRAAGSRLGTAILLLGVSLLPSSLQGDHTSRLYEVKTGRFQCGGQWHDFTLTIQAMTDLLGVSDPDAGIRAVLNFSYSASATRSSTARYKLAGSFDRKTGHVHLEPTEWASTHPDAFEMVGIDGTFDVETRTMTGKALGAKCDALVFAEPGKPLPPIPVDNSALVAASATGRPEMKVTPTNVTNYLDGWEKYFEYWVTAWSERPGTVHTGEPIDEENAWLKGEKWLCLGSTPVRWDASGAKGTASDSVGPIQRYVIECVGECKGLQYQPYVGANVTHLGLSEPLPTLEIKNTLIGTKPFEWRLSRTSPSGPPPEVYIHHWRPLTGYGPFDGNPAEIQRQMAAAPPCKAPRKSR